MRSDQPNLTRLSLVQPNVGFAFLFQWDQHHDVHEMIYVVRGRYRVETRQGVWSGEPGDAFIFPAGLQHRPKYACDGSVAFFVCQWRGSLPLPPAMSVKQAWRTRDPFGRLLITLQWMWEHTPSQKQGDKTLCHHLLAAMILECKGLLAGEPAPRSAVKLVQQYLRNDFAQPVTLGGLAKLAGLSRFRLIRVFRQELGSTPMRYLQKLRVDKALSLLLTTPMTLQQIAAKVGLTNPFYLSRLIKRELGRSPRSLRDGKISRAGPGHSAGGSASPSSRPRRQSTPDRTRRGPQTAPPQ